MYPNLDAEMKRIGLRRKDLAPLFKNRIPSVTEKLTGRYPIALEECLMIRDTHFPNLTLDYLFSKEPANVMTEKKRHIQYI